MELRFIQRRAIGLAPKATLSSLLMVLLLGVHLPAAQAVSLKGRAKKISRAVKSTRDRVLAHPVAKRLFGKRKQEGLKADFCDAVDKQGKTHIVAAAGFGLAHLIKVLDASHIEPTHVASYGAGVVVTEAALTGAKPAFRVAQKMLPPKKAVPWLVAGLYLTAVAGTAALHPELGWSAFSVVFDKLVSTPGWSLEKFGQAMEFAKVTAATYPRAIRFAAFGSVTTLAARTWRWLSRPLESGAAKRKSASVVDGDGHGTRTVTSDPNSTDGQQPAPPTGRPHSGRFTLGE